MCAFNTNTPGTLDWVRDVTGFAGSDTRLIGMDFRAKNGVLYGVGNWGGIYTLPTVPPANGTYPIVKVGQLSVALDGTSFGVDFNPAADRLRITSDTGQNLRHDVDLSSTVKDVPLTLNGAPAKGVTAAAYTNNDNNADTVTTLFDIDTVSDQVSIQAPANNGTLSPTGKLVLTTGTGVDAGLNADADIFADLSNGKTVSNTAFVTLLPSGGRQSFYTVDVLTGIVTLIGTFPSIAPVTDVAVTLDTN
ncbi:DUF4394 domain-containing protein [Actinophytocola sp.]|uniref:DUF4394 domain-containing protein n=1 Tax=Actinophytocola sp. TaxID=1872138 RepID=UPI002ED61171